MRQQELYDLCREGIIWMRDSWASAVSVPFSSPFLTFVLQPPFLTFTRKLASLQLKYQIIACKF